MLGDLSGVSKLYLITGRTDMRLSIDGLMAIIRDTYQMDPYANALYLFCGRKSDRLKALHHDKTGFVLLYMRLDSGKFQWPRNASEVRTLSRQEYRWLMEGLSIDQPKALRPSQKRDFGLFCGGITCKKRLSTNRHRSWGIIHASFPVSGNPCG